MSSRTEVQTSTSEAARILRERIFRREMSPGEQIRQEEIASQLGFSRSPLREALRTLEAEGLVHYSANQGYFVAQLTRAELQQIYLMRRLLEAELLRQACVPTDARVKDLRGANAAVVEAVDRGSVIDMLVANRIFHFTLLRFSALKVIVEEVERLWYRSEGYRATYLWAPETRRRIIREHEEMIKAFARGNPDQLIEVAARHRAAAERYLMDLLPARPDSTEDQGKDGNH